MTAIGEFVALHPFPRSPAPALQLSAAAVLGGDGALALRYRIDGDLGGVCVPAPQAPGPADGLWRHTCFEAFVADGASGAYREFNFSPSGQWALYRFRGYRERDSGAHDEDDAPRIAVRATATSLELDASVPARQLPAAAPMRLGLAAVVERGDGTLSYWALHHPGARPDFHDSAGFVLEPGNPAGRPPPARKP